MHVKSGLGYATRIPAGVAGEYVPDRVSVSYARFIDAGVERHRVEVYDVVLREMRHSEVFDSKFVAMGFMRDYVRSPEALVAAFEGAVAPPGESGQPPLSVIIKNRDETRKAAPVKFK